MLEKFEFKPTFVQSVTLQYFYNIANTKFTT